ncbi:Phosphotransferase [Aphelenchoides fujianensis]|nr:Phosphotransferase [Aphelenchoides fujianensis]
MELDSAFGKAGVNVHFLVKKTRTADVKFAEMCEESAIKQISTRLLSEGKGFSSRVFRTTFEFQDDRKFSLVVKLPTQDYWEKMNEAEGLTEEERESNTRTLTRMHNNECDAYELLAEWTDIPAARTFYLERADGENKMGMIFMEDLSERGGFFGLFHSATAAQTIHLAVHVADFQAHVEMLPEERWRGRYKEGMYTKPEIGGIWKKIMKICLEYPDQEIVKIVEKFLETDIRALNLFTLIDMSDECRASTICHGDLWTDNVCIGKDEKGQATNEIVAIADWQTLFIGNPLFDLARFLSNCVDADERRKCETEAISAFYDRLQSKVAEHGKKPRFSRQQAAEFYALAFAEQIQVLLVMFALIVHPLRNSADPEDVEKRERLADRLKQAAKDAMPTARKFEFGRRFGFDASE